MLQESTESKWQVISRKTLKKALLNAYNQSILTKSAHFRSTLNPIHLVAYESCGAQAMKSKSHWLADTHK